LINEAKYSTLSDVDKRHLSKERFNELEMYRNEPCTLMTKQYHALEKFILKHRRYKALSAKSEILDQLTIVTVRQRYPAVLGEMYFLEDGPSNTELAERLLKKFNNVELTFSE
jgi:hypothetical protein